MANTSIWLSQVQPPAAVPSQPVNALYDVVIVGAGIVGVSTAYHLADSQLSVALVESHSAFFGVTGNTTGKLTAQHGLIYDHLINTFGPEYAQGYADANRWAIQFVRETSASLGIECDLATESAYIYSLKEDEREKFEKELEACKRLGLPTAFHEKLDLPFGSPFAIEMQNQSRYHPLKFLRGLLNVAMRKGVNLFEGCRVLEIDEKEDVVELQLEDKGIMQARQVVIATNYPIHDSGWYVAKLAPYRSYALALELNQPPLEGMYISEHEPMRSLRRQIDETGEYQIVGGEHHKVGQEEHADQRYDYIEEWARKHFDVKRVAYRWSTQDNWTVDRVPYVGKSPDRDLIFVATGFGGWGMTNGIASGRLIADDIRGVENPWHSVFNPSRMPLSAVPKLVSENINVAGRLIGDRLGSAPEDKLEDLQPGSGAVVQMDDRRIAAYRDANGTLHAVSPVCTHLGCQVAWNNAEQSWDCPCHGSRFGIDGEVLHGPATKPLAPESLGEEKE